jgi:hypothetical protein
MATLLKELFHFRLDSKFDSIRPLKIRPNQIVFYTVLAFVYLLSGIIILTNIFPYRLGLVSFLIIPLFLFYGIKVDRVLLAFLGLTIIVFFSGILNGSSLLEVLIFLRILAFSYLIYYLVEIYINKANISKILSLCTALAIVQLPVIIVQQLTYDYLPERLRLGILRLRWDFAFGTFRPGDSALNFFLNLLLIYLLFNPRSMKLVKYGKLLALWLSVTVLISSSEISKVILVIIWGSYFITHINRKTTLYFGFAFVIVITLLVGSGYSEALVTPVTTTINRAVRDFSPERVELYLEGSYARGAALYYFFTNDILWFGDGPSKYTDPISGERLRGNMGHVYTFYSEVGLLGWLMSVLIYFLIAFRPNKGKIKFTLSLLLMFIAVQILSFTNNIMNDISVVLTYCIMVKTNLYSENMVESSSSPKKQDCSRDIQNKNIRTDNDE